VSNGRIAFGVGAGTLSLVVDGLCGVALIHLLFRYLGRDQVGLWQLFTTLSAFLQLAQNSLGPTLAREVARLGQTGRAAHRGFSIRPEMLNATRIASLAVLGAGLLCHVVYLGFVSHAHGVFVTGSCAWLAYVIGVVFHLRGMSFLFVLNGVGEVGWDKVLRIATSLGALGLSWIGLRSGLGLLALGTVFLAQNVAVFLGARAIAAWRGVRTEAEPAGIETTSSWPLLRDSLKLLLLSGTGYIVLFSSTIVVERVFGAETLGRFGAVSRAATLLASVALLIPQMSYPFVARAWAQGAGEQVRRIFVTSIVFALAVFLMGAAGLYAAADWAFSIWLGKGNYLGNSVLLALLLFQLVYVNHVAHSTAVLGAIGTAFVVPAVINACLVPPLMLAGAAKLGVAGVPLGMLAATLLPSVWVVLRSWRVMLQGPLQSVTPTSAELKAATE
jgi:O-antigen/teichoic acid export membrane protein